MKKKLLFFIPNLAHGGAERVLVNLVNNLDQNKYDVTVQTLFNVGINRQYLKQHIHYKPGFSHVIRGNTHIQKLFSPEVLYSCIIDDKYDIVISYLEGVTARILSGCHEKDTKKVAWIHTGMTSSRIASCSFRSLSEARRCYSSYDKLVMVSQDVEKYFTEYFNHNDICVLYNTNETEEIKKKAKLIPSDFQYPINHLTVCSTGRLISVKGFDRLLSVHKRLLDEGYPHTVCILGIGEEEQNLRRKIREYGVENSFLLLGFKENPYPYVARCDLYVCSSRREGFSTAVTEALVVGAPVVSTDCSGAKELLGEHDEYGLVVENSEEGIYRGMKRMLSEPEMLVHYRKMAVERGQVFSRERTVRAVEEMLDSL
ncbi:MAG: glycosyltransferase [Clostridia bacterium]|nr:glycosyltransferase [Clostridia bacterium]